MSSTFKPIDLNSEIVKEIMQNCSVTKNSKEYYKVVLEQMPMGYPKDSKPFLFDADNFDENIFNFYYLFGQLKVVHEKKHLIPIRDTLNKYDGTIWAKDKVAAFFLVHSAIGASIIMPPTAQTKSCIVRTDILNNISPTLSPNDPNFPKWWEEHKTEWLNAMDMVQKKRIIK